MAGICRLCRGLPVAALTPGAGLRGGVVMESQISNLKSEISEVIVFENVSKFYGEVLGVNRVNLTLKPGITSLVGPNGAGKTTLMNLMTGLLQPTKGSISVLGMTPRNPERFFRAVGY